MTDTSAVSFRRRSHRLPSAGRLWRHICGNVTSRKMWRRRIPSAAAASDWPLPMACQAPRMTSRPSAPDTSVRAITPAAKGPSESRLPETKNPATRLSYG